MNQTNDPQEIDEPDESYWLIRDLWSSVLLVLVSVALGGAISLWYLSHQI